MNKFIHPNCLDMFLSKTSSFYPNACHVCRKYGKDAKLKRCANCKMIAYCSREHQRKHWHDHKDFCKIASKAVKDLSGSICGTIELRKHSDPRGSLRMMQESMMLLIRAGLDRKLLTCEERMVWFTRSCFICAETNHQVLIDCPDCPAISFCRDHANVEHKNVCEQARLSCEIDSLYIRGMYNIPVPIINEDIPGDMQGLINLHRKVYDKHKTELPLNIWTAVTADRLSRPYTFHYAVQKLSTPRFPQNVHILGGTEDEISGLHWWSMFRHKQFSKNFKITLIGPSIKSSSFTCSGLSVTTIGGFYHDYATSEQFTKPDFIVGFNLGVHSSLSEHDTWAPTIKEIEKQKCPFLLTFFSLIDWGLDSIQINSVLKRDAKFVHFGKNPYRSFRPILEAPPESIIYSNQYLVVYEQL